MTFWQVALAILILTFAVICGFLKKRMNYFKTLGIPHIPPWPIVGNLGPVILGRKHIFQVIQDAYDLNPDARYVGFYNFIFPVVILRDPELIHSVTITNFHCFPDRRDVEADSYKHFGLFFMHRSKWREARSSLSPMFSSSKMKMMFNLMTECARKVSTFVIQESLNRENIVYVKNIFTKYTNDVIATCAFGISIDSSQNPNNEFYLRGLILTKLEGIFNIKLFLVQAFPYILKLPKVEIITRKVTSFFKTAMTDVVELRVKNNIFRPDMIQMILDSKGKGDKSFELNIDEVWWHALSFFFAGYETTSNSMSFMARDLMLHPDVQSKLQDEIDEVLNKTGGSINYDHIQSMTYLDAVLSEANRRHMAILLERMCVKNWEFPPTLPDSKPFVAKPGMVFIIPSHSLQNDSRYYDNPLEFDPDRFYYNKVDTKQTTYLSFGIGPRMCIGRRFALLKIKIMFFYLLANCNLRPCAKSNVRDATKKWGISCLPKGKFWMKIEARSGVREIPSF